MKIIYHRNFERKFKKLPAELKEKTIKTIDKFSKNAFDKSLKNHPLKGLLLGKRAISVTGDLRIIFEQLDGHVVVLMLDIGTHNQVY